MIPLSRPTKSALSPNSPTDAATRELARQVMLDFQIGDKWLAALDPDSPRWLVDLQREMVDAFRRGDLEWLLADTHPEAEIVQPPEIPGARSFRGQEGMIEALLDWPREWENFQLEPKRIFAVDDDQVVVVAVHRGRSRQIEIEVEAEIVWLFTRREGQMTRWDMFMSVEQALHAAGQAESNR